MAFSKIRYAAAVVGLFLMVSGPITAHGQVFGKILKAMAEQIGDLEECLQDLEKGYQELESGLHTIGDIKNGEFSLHKVFFASLKTVNPKISQLSEVKEITDLETAIVHQTSAALAAAKSNKWLQPSELAYLQKFYSALLRASTEDLDELVDLNTDDRFEMTDGERIQRIQAIDKDMQSQYAILNEFNIQGELLTQQREREFRIAGGLGSLFGK